LLVAVAMSGWVCPRSAFFDRQRTLEQRFGLAVAFLVYIHGGQIVQGRSQV